MKERMQRHSFATTVLSSMFLLWQSGRCISPSISSVRCFQISHSYYICANPVTVHRKKRKLQQAIHHPVPAHWYQQLQRRFATMIGVESQVFVFAPNLTQAIYLPALALASIACTPSMTLHTTFSLCLLRPINNIRNNGLSAPIIIKDGYFKGIFDKKP